MTPLELSVSDATFWSVTLELSITILETSFTLIYVVNESKIGCHVMSKTWDILCRTISGSFTYVYTRGPWAVEYLAILSRLM